MSNIATAVVNIWRMWEEEGGRLLPACHCASIRLLCLVLPMFAPPLPVAPPPPPAPLPPPPSPSACPPPAFSLAPPAPLAPCCPLLPLPARPLPPSPSTLLPTLIPPADPATVPSCSPCSVLVPLLHLQAALQKTSVKKNIGGQSERQCGRGEYWAIVCSCSITSQLVLLLLYMKDKGACCLRTRNILITDCILVTAAYLRRGNDSGPNEGCPALPSKKANASWGAEGSAPVDAIHSCQLQCSGTGPLSDLMP